MMNDHERINEYVLLMRGVRTGQACKDCSGLGTQMYGSTATWRKNAIAGQAFTVGPCDKCWGSGIQGQPWPSHKEFETMRHRLKQLRGHNDST
jgi:hypothetical protein